MQPRYEYTRLLVTDFRACFRFYRDVMGFEATFGTEDDTFADFETGTTNISLFDKQEMSETVGTSALPASASAQDQVCLVFTVENVEEACREITAKGVSLVVQPTDHPDWGIRTAHLRDPEGNLIEINQPLAR